MLSLCLFNLYAEYIMQKAGLDVARVCACARICIYVCACAHVCMPVCTGVCVCMCAPRYVCMYVCSRVCVCVCVCVCIFSHKAVADWRISEEQSARPRAPGSDLAWADHMHF